jgi:hypothetical protein
MSDPDDNGRGQTSAVPSAIEIAPDLPHLGLRRQHLLPAQHPHVDFAGKRRHFKAIT